MDELEDVGVDDPPLLDGRDDRGEVVVGDDHVGRLLGHLRPLDAHRHADVGLLQGRRVVDAVAGHGDDLASPLERLDELQLVLRRDAGEDAGRGNDSVQASGVEPLEFAGVHGRERPAERVAVEPELPADLGRRGRLVAGDHDGPDPRLAAGGDGVLHLVAERVDHPDEPDEHEVAVEVRAAVVLGKLAVGQPQHAQGGSGQLAVPSQMALAVFLRQRLHAGLAEMGAAQVEQRPRRALDEGDGGAGRRCDGR